MRMRQSNVAWRPDSSISWAPSCCLTGDTVANMATHWLVKMRQNLPLHSIAKKVYALHGHVNFKLFPRTTKEQNASCQNTPSCPVKTTYRVLGFREYLIWSTWRPHCLTQKVRRTNDATLYSFSRFLWLFIIYSFILYSVLHKKGTKMRNVQQSLKLPPN